MLRLSKLTFFLYRARTINWNVYQQFVVLISTTLSVCSRRFLRGKWQQSSQTKVAHVARHPINLDILGRHHFRYCNQSVFGIATPAGVATLKQC